MIALYIFGALLVLLLAGVLLAPLLEDEEADLSLEELPPEERRRAAREALRELEFERETGKVPEEDYRQMRARYGRIAAEARKALEAADAPDAPGDPPAAAAAETADGDGAGRPAPGEAAGRCGACGAKVRAGARYCPRCGTAQTDEP